MNIKTKSTRLTVCVVEQEFNLISKVPFGWEFLIGDNRKNSTSIGFREIVLGEILQAIGSQDGPIPTQILNLAQN